MLRYTSFVKNVIASLPLYDIVPNKNIFFMVNEHNRRRIYALPILRNVLVLPGGTGETQACCLRLSTHVPQQAIRNFTSFIEQDLCKSFVIPFDISRIL